MMNKEAFEAAVAAEIEAIRAKAGNKLEAAQKIVSDAKAQHGAFLIANPQLKKLLGFADDEIAKLFWNLF